MWLEIEYSPTSLFSLKSSQSTNSGGKSLFSPSPYAIKMALLNAIITYDSLEIAKKRFGLIRDLNISFKLPNNLVVNNCMIRINKVKRNDKQQKEKAKLMKEQGKSEREISLCKKEIDSNNPFGSTIAFREYVYLHGNIKVIIDITNLENDKIDFLKKWFVHINYFGKKGCFFQFISSRISEKIDHQNYSFEFDGKLIPGVLSKMDDMDPEASFDNVNNFSTENALRISRIYNIPIKQVSSSKEYHVYEVLNK